MIIGNNLETLRAELKKKVMTDKVKELNIKEEQEEEEKVEDEEEALFTDEEEDSIEEEVRGKGGREGGREGGKGGREGRRRLHLLVLYRMTVMMRRKRKRS